MLQNNHNQAKILAENFSKGLFQVDIPKLSSPSRGKVRDSWIIKKGGDKIRVMVTTDRQSAFVQTVCTIPGKGQISNLISAYWFERTKDIIPNNMISIIHPNVIVARQAKKTIPDEVILRRYLAEGSTPTSLYYNYFNKGRREIYGIRFPDNLSPNQELPMGTIITPTTKAKNGHDKELTDKESYKIIDGRFGKGVWDKIKSHSYKIFERARIECLSKGLILADTKFEFGIDKEGNLMLIDEVLTPECSRYWLSKTYKKKLGLKRSPDPDKDILINWLKNKGFNGKGKIPKIDKKIINRMIKVYKKPYNMISGKKLYLSKTSLSKINKAIMDYIKC